ncbi:MAG TPA: NAD-dependent epimerase/dehydratase family protein [Pseudolysinimonas sp.]|nr:NAD-dependent epimerase/dehydratase family protein [Pseudolysinimonas sp.]
MRTLVLGGTAWLGRHIVSAAIDAGHEVTALARGEAGAAPVGARFVAADRDREDAFDDVGAQSWDAVIDVSRQPGQVRRAVAALASRTGHWVYVSSSSVYSDSTTIGDDEAAALLPPLDGDVMQSMEDYGSAKVSCERFVLDVVGERRSLVARSSLIGGPGDWSGRSGYWPRRFARPSNPERRVLIPDAPDVPVQLLDVRDLAAWLVRAAERGTAGIANAGGPTHTFAEHLEAVRTVTGFDGSWEVAGEDWLAEHGVEPWMGPRSLPLWLPAESIALNAHDVSRGARLGLRTRPLSETLADTLAWELEDPGERRAGLADDDERELLAALLG